MGYGPWEIGGLFLRENLTVNLCGTLLGLPFGFPDALLDHLAGGLGGNPPEVVRSGFNNDNAAKLCIWLCGLGVLQRHLGAVILHVFDNLSEAFVM